MDKQNQKDVKQLDNWEGDVYLWIEQESSIMVKAADKKYGDPVELTSEDARKFAKMLLEAADELDNL